ncbi:MAG: sugar kinase [Verrucomicrobia bacterium]|nr:sugar kinase [Verrucomicrobiota bacterium]
MSAYPRSAQPALIIGSVAIDRVATPLAQSDNLLGGAASYASIAASYFAPTRLLGVVGGDFPKPFWRRLQKHGIDLSGLKVEPEGKTFFWSGKYHENFAGRDTLELGLNVFQTFSPQISPAWLGTPFVMLGAIMPALQNQVLDQFAAAKKKPFVLADTFDHWINSTRPELERMMQRIDLFVINEDESLLFTGQRNLVLAGRQLRRMGPRIVVIKKGAHGSLLFHPDGFFAIPAYPVTKFIDPTGAGDSYAGAMIGYLASVNRTDFAAMKKAVAYATAVSSLTVESFSVNRLSAGGRRSVDARFKELAANSRF